jgi:hypothetical protein
VRAERSNETVLQEGVVSLLELTPPEVAATPPQTSPPAPHAATEARAPQASTQRPAAKRTRPPAWAMEWGFWLTLTFGAALRLFPLRFSPFGIDSALLMIEANRAVRDGVIPGTGIFNSILALNPPLYTYLLLLFARQPFGMTILTALANVAGVVALYFFARRHFGPLVATIAGLLYATAGYAVYMSTFIWQQTILPPLIIAALILLFEGAVRGRRYWLIPNVALVALLIQLYPVMVSMLVLTLVGAILAWRTIRWWEAPLAVVVGALFFAPTVLFEIASDGFDLPIYRAYLLAPKILDGQVFSALGLAIGPVDQAILGPATLYATLAPTFLWLTPVILVLVYASVIWLALVLLAPIPTALWRRSWAPIPRALRAPRWRAYLLLLLWPLAFLALTLRHSSPVYPHYVFVLLPVLYVSMGLFLVRFPMWLGYTLPRLYLLALEPLLGRASARPILWWLAHPEAGRTLGRAPRSLFLCATGVLLGAQLLTTSLFMGTIMLGRGATPDSGTGIAGYDNIFAAAERAANSFGSRDVFIAADQRNPYLGQYWTAQRNSIASPGDPHWVSYQANDCILTPGAGERPDVLIASDQSGMAVRQVIAEAGGVPIATPLIAPGIVVPLYAVQPQPAITQPPLATVNGELQLDAATLMPASAEFPARLITRWTMLTSTPPGPAVSQYHFHALFTTPQGTLLDAFSHCAPTSWRAGQGLTIITPLPGGLPRDYAAKLTAAPIGKRPRVARIQLLVERDTHTWYRPKLGPIPLETAKELTINRVVLPLGATPSRDLLSPLATNFTRAMFTIPNQRVTIERAPDPLRTNH